MPDYDFHTLSPIDFENLVRDLLQAELSVRLETFKAGRDKGIDLRYSNAGSDDFIVQAKHYAGTGFAGLLSHLKLNEKPKIYALRPKRYLLATSVPLSPANKDEIRKTLAPYVQGPKDVYGREDINNLVGLFPQLERQHFKLWLSSTTVLEEVLHSRILKQTRITLDDIKNKARLYVSNRSFNLALDILKQHNYVIIAGIPGIGKTTLAKMLVLHFLNGNYDFIDISYDISEAYTVPEYTRPRIYLYDDFLGRTSIEEKLRKNEDHRLLDFISAIRRSKSAKLILTTREYILRQAQRTYEVLNTPLFEKPQCIVDLSQYTRPIRAQILYNHLYFSRLPRENIEAIVQQAAYLKIVDHPNFSPRIVEYMTDPMWVECRESARYPAVFLRNLQEPFLIWEQAFDTQLTNMARETLIVLCSLPRELFVEDLESAVRKFAFENGGEVSAASFRAALAELQGNFVLIRRDRENDIVMFHNPSVQDFIEGYLDKNPDVFERLLKGACFFEQVHWTCRRIGEDPANQRMESQIGLSLYGTLSVPPCALINYSSGRGNPSYKGRDRLKTGSRFAFLAGLLKKHGFPSLRERFRSMFGELIKEMPGLRLENDDLLTLATEVKGLDCVGDMWKTFCDAAKESLFANAFWLSDVLCIAEFFALRPGSFTAEQRDRVIETVDGIIDNLDDDDPQLLEGELESLEAIEKQYALGLGERVERVQELLTSAEENVPPEPDYDEDRYRGTGGGDWIGNDALADMFSTLVR